MGQPSGQYEAWQPGFGWVPIVMADYEPTDAECRAFANAYGYSVEDSRAYLRRNGPDARYHGTGSSAEQAS